MKHFRLHIPILALLAYGMLCIGQTAQAQQWEVFGSALAGREAEILALIEPFRDEKHIVDGWRVVAVQVSEPQIRLELEGPSNEKAALLLKHKSNSGSAESTLSFRLEREGGKTAQKALTELAQAVRLNDRSSFWPTGSEAERRLSHVAGWESPHRHPRHQGDLLSSIASIARDGIVLALLALFFILIHLRRTLKKAPAWVPWALFGFVVVGGLLRLAMSPETVMNAWPYTRTPPLVKLIMSGDVMDWVSRRFGLAVHLTDAIHTTDLIVATLTPLVFFAHAQFVLKSWKGALFASGLLVVLPVHLHFSYSDVEYVQSLATSSLTFVALYTALQDPSRVWRWSALVLLPFLSLATYDVRPENMVFVVVDVGAVLLTAGRNIPLPRRARVLVAVIGTAAYSFVTHLLVNYGHNVSDGLSWWTLQSAARGLFNPNTNTLLNPWITPPLVLILAGAGLVVLLRSQDWRRALYLFGWLAGFYVVHSYVIVSEPAMMARYHMHLITPVLLLAGAAIPLLSFTPRGVAVAFGVSLALSPLIHRSFITTNDFIIMQEYDLLRANRALVPDGCVVLEFLPVASLVEPNAGPGDSRMLRHGRVLARGLKKERWRVVNLAEVPSTVDGSAPDHEVLTQETRELLASPPQCLVFLEGMTCRTHKPDDQERATVCEDVLREMHVETLAETTFPARIYDEYNVRRFDGPPGLQAGDPVHIALHRLSKPPNEPALPATTAK